SSITRRRPEIKLSDGHKRQHAELIIQMELIQITARISLEKIRDHVSVYHHKFRVHHSTLRSLVSRLHSRIAFTKSSTLSSSGKNSPSLRSSAKFNGFLP